MIHSEVTQSTPALLRVKNLVTTFNTEDGLITPVNDVSFEIYPKQTLGIVGESGCGKSVTALSIMGLIPKPFGKIPSGEIWLENKNLLTLSDSEYRSIRGNQIGMIFQEPMTALNPVFTIGNQLSEPFKVHQNLNKQEAELKSLEMLKLVGIPDAHSRLKCYPHELSGGMRQRVMIAMALTCRPKILIADEPTTALDVTIQAQILELMKSLQKDINTAIMLITHDLGVVAETCQEVIVMYAGRIVEKTDVHTIFNKPAHPYTQGLINSVPDIEDDHSKDLQVIEGLVPSLFNLPKGCSFANRCKNVQPQCLESAPNLIQISNHHWVACHLHTKPFIREVQ